MSCFSRDKGGFVTPPLQQPESSSISVITVNQGLIRHSLHDRIEYEEGPRDNIVPPDAISNEDAIEFCPEDFPEPIYLTSSPTPDATPELDKATDDDGLTPSKRSTPDPGPCCSETMKRSRLGRFFICCSSPPQSPPSSPYRRRDTSLKQRELAQKKSDLLCKVHKPLRSVSAPPVPSTAPGPSTSAEATVFRMDEQSEQCMVGANQRWLDFDHAARERTQVIGHPDDDADDMLFAQQYLGFVATCNITKGPTRRANASAFVSSRDQHMNEAAASAAFTLFERTSEIVKPPVSITVTGPSTDVAVQAVAATKLREVQTVRDFTQVDNLKEVLENLPVHPSVRRKTNKKVDIVHFTLLYSPPSEFADGEAVAGVNSDSGDRYHITFQPPEPDFDPDDYNDANFTYTIYGDIDEETDDITEESASLKSERRREYLI